MSNKDRTYYPSGKYRCLHCSHEVEVFVKLTAIPTHSCGVGKRTRLLVHEQEGKDEAGNSIG